MAVKRRDNKGRVLRNGESQRPDGRYEFKYVDEKGARRSVYSWRLASTDKLPSGKHQCVPLREIEINILKDIDDGIDTHTANKITLNSFFDTQIETRYELKRSTILLYKYMYTKYIHDNIGMKSIASIKYSDIKKFYLHLISDLEFKSNTVEVIQTILQPIFNIAVRDGYIRANPTD